MRTQQRSGAKSPPKPTSQASRYADQQRKESLTRLGLLLLIIVFAAFPALPSPIASFDWKAYVWSVGAPFLLTLFPSGPGRITTMVRAPILIWLYRAAAGLGAYFIWCFITHLRALYAQRTRPIRAERVYLQLMVPLNLTPKPDATIALLQTLHGMAPASSPLQGVPAPLVLRWTGMPEQPIKQGLSLVGPATLITGVQKTLEGVGKGTEANVMKDPLLDACTPGRWLCWTDVRLQGPQDLPIAMPNGAQSPLIDALLPALLPQSGIVLADVHIILQPSLDRGTHTKILARLEVMKPDTAGSERRLLEQKAQSATFRVTMRLLAVAETPEAGTSMVTTMASTLAASAQGIATMQQRLMAGPVQTVPTGSTHAPVMSRALRTGCMLGGCVAGAALALWLHRSGLPFRPDPRWGLPICLVPLPLLLLTAIWRKRAQVEQDITRLTILKSVPPPRNPNCIPIWSSWFGHHV